MFRGIILLQVVPQVHVFTNGRVYAADITHQLPVKEHPHVVIPKEDIFHGSPVSIRDRELNLELEPEIRIVVYQGIRRRYFTYVILATVRDIPVFIAEFRVMPISTVGGRIIHRPELICPDHGFMVNAIIRPGVYELLKPCELRICYR